jgi:hypothetical protein
MSDQFPHQCDICFQPYSPFSTMRVLPVTPIIALSGTATPTHVRIPDAKISVCRYCLQSFSNLEPWTDTISSPDLSDSYDHLETPNSLEHPDSPASLADSDPPEHLDASVSPDAPNTPSPSPSQFTPKADTLRPASTPPYAHLLSLHDTLIKAHNSCHFCNFRNFCHFHISHHFDNPCKFVSFVSFSICNGISIRSPPRITQKYPLLHEHLLPMYHNTLIMDTSRQCILMLFNN